MEEIFKVFGFMVAFIMGVFLSCLACYLITCWVISGFEYGTWNKLHGTSYTRYEWFTGSDFIKKYHYPERERANIHELNINSN